MRHSQHERADCDSGTPREAPRPWAGPRRSTASGTVVVEAAAGLAPADVFAHVAGHRHALFLDTAMPEAPATEAAATLPPLGRWSFVTADPIHSVRVAPGGDVAAAFGAARRLLADFACPTIPGLPPFQGGLAGLVSYDGGLARIGLPIPNASLPGVPLVSLHLYDVVYAYDHVLGRGWFISQGLPARGPTARRRRAAARLDAFLAAPPAPPPRRPDVAPSCRATIGTSHPLDRYQEMVRGGIEAVLAGDVFQVNLAQRLTVAADVDPVRLHMTARRINPAPFAACFDTGGTHLVSMSPERFLQASLGVVRMHPIKGTRRVLASPEADLYAAADLGVSDKDRAENVMIVDLVRNDLARVCLAESVRVEALCRLERFRYVQHLVSVVAGRLRPGLGPLDALEAAIPGGSVTGAPKHRACEIISALEGTARGAYCGCLGYLGLDGAADFNLLIRTFVVGEGMVSFSAGGGITAASDPAAEHAESLHKAEGMLRVLNELGIGGGAT
ncbi:MAG: anthranilate synthase component I family protein [Planctomycetes bacterium]|nr:anthranilate synthase component I family protein [Planctomycetota bacterium]